MKKLGLLFLFLLQMSCATQGQGKINGVSFVGSREKALQENADAIAKVNANYAAVMPFGYIRNINSPTVIFNTERQWFGESEKGAKQYIELLQKNNVKVMLKPQIWIWKGEFTGTLVMKTEEDWAVLEKSYSNFILTYAALAEETKVPLLCIGTELELFVENRPDYWKELIKEIRKLYKGKLTYAANWDEFKRTSFWEDVDYIGIDAYFPLSDKKTPTVIELKEGWQKHKKVIAALSKEKNKPVLFTEYGYRSTDYNADKPWTVDRHENPVNLIAQSNATQVILEEFWTEDWFAGGFVWKWFIDYKKAGGEKDNRFTPQNKPAQEVLKKYYEIY